MNASPLTEACMRGDVNQVKSILEKNPELLNSRLGEAEETPLHLAVSFGHRELFDFLISIKAKTNVGTFCDHTPLDYAMMFKQDAMYEVLMKLGGCPSPGVPGEGVEPSVINLTPRPH